MTGTVHIVPEQTVSQFFTVSAQHHAGIVYGAILQQQVFHGNVAGSACDDTCNPTSGSRQ